MFSKRKNVTSFGIVCIVGLLYVFAFSITICDDVNAWNYSSVNDCISKSNITDYSRWTGDSGIEWACNKATSKSGTVRYCVMWIGTKTSLDIDLQVGRSNSISANVWGMCANSESHGGRGNIAKWISITNDNGAFSEPGQFMRGAWGSPSYTSVSIDIDKFEHGITPVVRNGKKEYTRTVSVYRCNGGDPTEGTVGETRDSCKASSSNKPSNCNCDWEYPTITLIDPIPKVTLNGYAVTDYRASDNAHKFLKTDGTVSGWATSAPSNAVKRTSGEVDAGSSASVSFSDYNPDGYSFSWGSSCPVSSRSGKSCTINPLNSNKDVYAYYARNEFKGRARIKSGTAVDNTNSTGYVTDTSTKSIEVDCVNTGCKVAWDLALSRTGSGTTGYYIGASSNGGTIGYTPNSALAFPRTGVTGTVSSGTGTSSDSLLPGQSKCHYVKFRPYGAKDDDEYAVVGACATAKVTTFKGKSSVSGTNAGTSTTNWQNTNTTQTGRITGCSPTSGCKVTFTHHMKITNAGGGSSRWDVTRSSNLITTTKGISTNRGSSASSGDFSDTTSDGVQVSTSGELTLWPGMVVCERLTFYPDNKSGTSRVYTQQCVSAEGDAQPPCTGTTCTPDCDTATDVCDSTNDKDPSGANTLINTKVKNNDVSAYGKYRKVVYAKPGDNVTYRSIYNPILQYTYHLKPQKMQIDGGTIYPTDSVNTSSSMLTLFNSHRGSMREWNNGFNMLGGKLSESLEYTYARGNMDKRTEYDEQTVVGSDVGKDLKETGITNVTTGTQTTPGQVEFRNDSGNNLGNVLTSSVQSSASVLVPYNFVNSTEITREENDYLYAGETASINFTVTTSPKRNNVTDGTYATIVKNAELELEVCYNGGCSTTASNVNPGKKKMNLNGNFNMEGDSLETSIDINIPDVAAGTMICFRSMVYPENSGADTNWSNESGNESWAYSGQKCFKVAKRPSIQVWGGNSFSRGAINMIDAVKNNLAGYPDEYPYQLEGTTEKLRVFGSWTELGLIATGEARGLSSGASVGFATNSDGGLWPSYHPADGGSGNNQDISGRAPGGSDKKSLCYRSPLSFANTECGSGLVGKLGDVTSVNSASDDKKAIIDTFIFGGSANIEDPNNVVLNSDSYKREGSNVYYYYGENNPLTIPAATIGKGTIQVVHSKNNITIGGDLVYEDSYADLEEIPKLVIYSENEIRIGCGVARIDAVLIADSVLTCDNVGDAITNDNIKDRINDSANSNQLKINGAIITDKLYPNRTYGAATGANSMIPAEIINFDPSLYIWGTSIKTETDSGENSDSGSLDITYRRELAPRL